MTCYKLARKDNIMQPQQGNQESDASGGGNVPDTNQQGPPSLQPQEPAQPSTIPSSPQEAPTMQPYTPTTPPIGGQPMNFLQSPKQSKTMLIVGIVIAIFVVIIATAATFMLKSSNNTAEEGSASDSQAAGAPEENSNLNEMNAVTATYITELDAVCKGGSISNAAQFTAAEKPYKVTAFSFNEAAVYERWSPVTLSSRTVPSSTDEVGEVSVVVCVQEKKGTAAKSTTCSYESSGENTSIDYYALQYEVEFREAKTGKSLGKGADVNGPAVRCPMFASYDRSNPRLYADPDRAALEEVVRTFVQ